MSCHHSMYIISIFVGLKYRRLPSARILRAHLKSVRYDKIIHYIIKRNTLVQLITSLCIYIDRPKIVYLKIIFF